jgi:hypothetical protein
MERSNGLSEAAKARETSLAHAEQKIKSLTDRVDQLEHDARTYRAKTVKRIDDLNETLQRERVEFAVAQGALETNRRDYARLQRGLSAEQAVPQSSPQVDGAPDASKPREPSRAKNGKGAGRGAKVMEAKPDDAAGEPTAPAVTFTPISLHCNCRRFLRNRCHGARPTSDDPFCVLTSGE